jgi:hypothetical protein
MKYNMRSNKKDVIQFGICVFKSFIILLVIGKLLPDLLQMFLENIIGKKQINHNSILVHNIISRKYAIFYNIIIVFKLFIKY